MDFPSNYNHLQSSAISKPLEYDFSDQYLLETALLASPHLQEHQLAPIQSPLWGSLRPCNDGLPQIDFSKSFYQFGSDDSEAENDVVFSGLNRVQFIIRRNTDRKGASVTIQDVSDDGTYLGGHIMTQNHYRILKDGDEISFGIFRLRGHTIEAYRYIFREVKPSNPTGELEALYDIEPKSFDSGASSVVMTALHRQSGITYAMKIIDKPLQPTGGRLTHEISIMKKLNHYNICKLKDVFFRYKATIIVMELAYAGNLAQYVDNHCDISASHELNSKIITFQTCNAMAYIHFKGIIHLDIKPENILLACTNPLMVKVADFGVSKMIEGSALLRSTRGTPIYMAPEIVDSSSKGYNNLVDSWSFGATLLYLITSKSPFKPRTDVPPYESIEQQISNRKIEWQYLDSSQVISQEAKDFIQRLLQDSPVTRTSLTDALELPWLMDLTREEEEEIQNVSRMLLGQDGDGASTSGYSETVNGGKYLEGWRRMFGSWRRFNWWDLPASLSPIEYDQDQGVRENRVARTKSSSAGFRAKADQDSGEVPGPHRATRHIRVARNTTQTAPISTRHRSNVATFLVKTESL